MKLSNRTLLIIAIGLTLIIVAFIVVFVVQLIGPMGPTNLELTATVIEDGVPTTSFFLTQTAAALTQTAVPMTLTP